MISDPEELNNFSATPDIEVMNMMFAIDDLVSASWRFIEGENIPSLYHTNELISAMVTPGAGLRLYSYLD